MAENWSTTGKTKHIDVRLHYLREMIEQGMIQIKFVKSEWNVSDIFTKNLSENLFQQHAETLVFESTGGPRLVPVDRAIDVGYVKDYILILITKCGSFLKVVFLSLAQ